MEINRIRNDLIYRSCHNLNRSIGTKGPILSLENAGLETYFFSHSQTFASGFNLNSQIAVFNSQ